MATSTSPDSASGWSAGALLFSGRPNPIWVVDPDAGRQLESIYNSLPAASASEPPPILGYRGCFLRHPTGAEWSAFSGLVTYRSGEAVEARRDADREFERTVLASAPEDILPRDFIKFDF
jgi:hypothetical protein